MNNQNQNQFQNQMPAQAPQTPPQMPPQLPQSNFKRWLATIFGIVIVVLIGGGILGYQYLWKPIVGPEPEATPTLETTLTPEITSTPEQKYPSLAKETMDKDLILNCLGGDEVSLWDKPTDAAGGSRARGRIPCGTFAWAFNKYHNEKLNVVFYAINTNDTRVKNDYGWVTEDLITWR